LAGIPTVKQISMITAAQLRAARLLLGIDQRRLAALSRLSIPTIQRMEASETIVRGNVDSLVKLIAAFDAAGIEMIDEGAVSNSQGRGVRLKMNSGSAKVDLNSQPEHKASNGTRGGA
jgi:transcriptional regulator with XRE-family HTH domain